MVTRRGLSLLLVGLAACKGTPKPVLEIVYSIDLDAAADDKATELARDIGARLADDRVQATVRTPATGPGALTIVVDDASKRAEATALVGSTYEQLQARDCAPEDPPGALCFALAEAYQRTLRSAALAAAVAVIRDRLASVSGATVRAVGNNLAVDLPDLEPDRLARTKDLIARTGKLTFEKVDDDSAVMKKLFAHVGSDRASKPTDPAALAAEIQAEVDVWRGERGPQHRDYYLTAHDREEAVPVADARRLGCRAGMAPDAAGMVRCYVTGRAVIERYVGDLAVQDPSLRIPDDRKLAYERVTPSPDASDQRRSWRSYLLERGPVLTGAQVTEANKAHDPNTDRPIVILELDRLGTRAFADATAQIVGRKLAIVLDGRITSAPVINAAIKSGRAAITMGGIDAAVQELEADDLAKILSTGALPAPLHEDSASPIPSP